MKRWLYGLLLGAAFAGLSSAQIDDIRKYPGYVDLEWIAVPDKTDDAVDVTIGPRLMRMVRKTRIDGVQKDSPDAGRVVSLQVKSFNVDSQSAERMKPILFEFERKLSKEDWRPVIRLKRPDGFTNVSVKYGAERKTDGFFIMSVNNGSAASFVNIIGDVDPDLLQGMLTNVNEDVLDSLRKCMVRHQREIKESGRQPRQIRMKIIKQK